MADVVEKTMLIQNELGLHARAATKLVQLASRNITSRGWPAPRSFASIGFHAERLRRWRASTAIASL